MSTRDSAPAQGPDDLDDEALSWAGDEDRGGVAPRRSGATATDAATDAASDAVEADPMGGQAGDEPDAGQTEPTPSSPARSAARLRWKAEHPLDPKYHFYGVGAR